MKKLKLFFISLLLFLPTSALAYSDYIITGEQTLGIEINSDGIMVIGFYQINGKYNKGNPEIKSGDYITKINGIDVTSVDELTKVIEDNVSDMEVEVTYMRNGKEKTSMLELVKDDNVYKTGLYVKDSITGIGTLSYIDPATKVFGALGHEIVESNTSSVVEIKSGIIFRNYITSIEKSASGIPGSKNAKFYYDTTYGTILKNTNVGIYGMYDATLPEKELLEVATPDEVKVGDAYIQTVLDGEEINNYDIRIISINETSEIKNISFEITDEELLDKTGGVVQGMSGSPIIQDDKIIGAVTHVVIDNPSSGYGIFITTMLEEGEK